MPHINGRYYANPAYGRGVERARAQERQRQSPSRHIRPQRIRPIAARTITIPLQLPPESPIRFTMRPPVCGLRRNGVREATWIFSRQGSPSGMSSEIERLQAGQGDFPARCWRSEKPKQVKGWDRQPMMPVENLYMPRVVPRKRRIQHAVRRATTWIMAKGRPVDPESPWRFSVRFGMSRVRAMCPQES
jgi:hypothetical protein